MARYKSKGSTTATQGNNHHDDDHVPKDADHDALSPQPSHDAQARILEESSVVAKDLPAIRQSPPVDSREETVFS